MLLKSEEWRGKGGQREGGGGVGLARHGTIKEMVPTSLPGPLSTGKEQRVVCSDGLVVEVEAVVLSVVGSETEQGRISIC